MVICVLGDVIDQLLLEFLIFIYFERVEFESLKEVLKLTCYKHILVMVVHLVEEHKEFV